MKIQSQSIFENAEDYKRARIPGIVCTDSGTLIAYCELRQDDSDWAVIDIGMKKSTDGGKSWSLRKIPVSGDGKNTVNNPVMITDGDTLHFLYCLNYRQVFCMKSTDAGECWSQPREITQSIREQTGDFFWSCIATGPTHGIRLSSGRLMVPVWLAFNKENEKSHHPSVISVIFSDDGGENWRVGEINGELSDSSEFCLCELNGKIIANIRHENPERCRAVGEVSADGRMENIRFIEELPDPVCCGGMCSLGEELLFSNCADEKRRINLTVRRLSENMTVKESLLISEDGGYSDVAVSPDRKTAYILFEKENSILCTAVEI